MKSTRHELRLNELLKELFETNYREELLHPRAEILRQCGVHNINVLRKSIQDSPDGSLIEHFHRPAHDIRQQHRVHLDRAINASQGECYGRDKGSQDWNSFSGDRRNNKL